MKKAINKKIIEQSTNKKTPIYFDYLEFQISCK